ncbi:MAG: HAD family hydrolase [Caldilinea sp. CFX5]|nr:HAD family hydrolase [Caldilinea sp. CFX5]
MQAGLYKVRELLAGGVGTLLGAESGVSVFFAHFRNRINMVVPVNLLHFLNRAAHAQILIKDGRSLDLLQGVDTLVFDKTGTLTEEQPQVAAIHARNGYHAAAILTYAAAEHCQSHPIAQAILSAAQARGWTRRHSRSAWA